MKKIKWIKSLMGIGTIGVLGVSTAISVTSCDTPSTGEKFISLTPKSSDDTHFTFGLTDTITYKYKTINFTDHGFEITGNDKDEFQITDINTSSSELTISKINENLPIGSYSFKIHDKTENIDSDEQNVSVIEPTIKKLYINGINNWDFKTGQTAFDPFQYIVSDDQGTIISDANFTSSDIPEWLSLSGTGELSINVSVPLSTSSGAFAINASKDGYTNTTFDVDWTIEEYIHKTIQVVGMSQLNYYQNDAISVQYDAYDTNTGGELTTGVTFDKSSGTLPENASLSANGLLSGTANVTGNNSFTIKASKDGYEDKVGLSVNWVISAPLAQDIQLTYTGSLDLKQAGDSINFTATPINFEPSNNITWSTDSTNFNSITISKSGNKNSTLTLTVGANGVSTDDATNNPHFAIYASADNVQSTKVTINLISNQTTVAVSKIMDTSSGRLINKGDEIVLQASVTNPSGVTAWNLSNEFPDGITKKEETGQDGSSTLFLTATKNIDTAASVDITASNNSVSSSTLNVGYGVANYAVVPVTATYFDMNANNEILGFSSAVVNDPSLLNSYNCLDLNNRVIAWNCRFLPSVFDNWKCNKIDLSNATFKMGFYDEQACYYSGFYTFANDDLSSVSILDLSNTIFAESRASVTNSSYSAYYTFAAANLSGLSTLNLNNTVFAALCADTTNAGTVYSASCTFRNANLSGLSSLDLSHAIFCVSDMGNGTVFTAYITFWNANLSGLSALNLNDVVFATANMSTTNNVNYSIRTAHETFYYANLSGITTLNLNNAVFAATDMSNGCSIYTADNTFFVANMPSILSLNFDGAIFAATNMMKQTVANNYLRTAYDTFLQAFLGQLTVIDFRDAILYIDQTYSAATSTPCYQTFYDARLVCLTDIYLPSTTSYTSNTAWSGTFLNAKIYSEGETRTIHGYSTLPSWWPYGGGTDQPTNPFAGWAVSAT